MVGKFRILKRRRNAYHDVLAVHRKNCDPLVLGPALAIDRVPEVNNSQSMIDVYIGLPT